MRCVSVYPGGVLKVATRSGHLRRVGVWVWLACGIALGGCQGPRNYTNENDKLRRENLHLSTKVKELKSAAQRSESQTRVLEARMDRGAALPGVTLSDIPRVMAIEFSRFSGAVDTDGDGRDDVIRVYVRPVDHLGRFLPAIGPAAIQAVAILPDRQPEVLAQRKLSPKQFEASYRAGLTGSHFTLELPLPASWPGEVEQVTVKLTFTDAATGARHSHEQPMAIKALP
jgi:hypothetical protein